MGVVDDVQRKLFEARCREQGDGPQLRASTMTHVVWAPPVWLERGRRVLAALEERHPARTIILVPEPRGTTGVDARVLVRDFDTPDGREVLSEVVELRLHGASARHPGSLVLPLLISDLPAFCRWRGEPAWDWTALAELVSACDRLVVDSSEWPAPARRYARLEKLFDSIAVSDLAWRRSLRWRAALAELWPGDPAHAAAHRGGPDRRRRAPRGLAPVAAAPSDPLTHRPARSLVAVAVDGEPVPRPAGRGCGRASCSRPSSTRSRATPCTRRRSERSAERREQRLVEEAVRRDRRSPRRAAARRRSR